MNKVQHFEIPAEDVGRAADFYKEVFGWEMIAIPEMGYIMLHTGPTDQKTGMTKEKGFINGGMMKKSSDIQHPVITIMVDSIDQAIKKLKKQGCEAVKEKMQVGDMGFAAYFKDSEGNVMGLWENQLGR